MRKGFTQQKYPVTQVTGPNMTHSFEGFHISYARNLAHYGCDTTALVLDGRVFFILNGDHADDLSEAASIFGVEGCVNLFIDRIARANQLSEHLMAVGLKADPFGLYPTTLEIIGLENIEKIARAEN